MCAPNGNRMALDKGISNGAIERLRGQGAWAWLALPLISASCTPMLAESPAPATFLLEAEPGPSQFLAQAQQPPAVPPGLAAAVAGSADLAPVGETLTIAFQARTPLDRLRSHDCLAQAIFYEAASESDEGQKAVAQVVLNRVRHPSWPNSVCGVVYQGPMRAGGGCQFSFTCDGSLARPARGQAWEKAQRLAADALAGRSRDIVGLATHYHTHEVSPGWAPRLARIGAIGAHNFYRLPGPWGEASAFAARYSGTEPMPRPSILLRPSSVPAGGAGSLSLLASGPAPSSALVDPKPLATSMQAESAPVSTVREEYRHSGQWRNDAPAAITGQSAS